MASLTQWTWVWASSGSWWWTGKPSVLQSMGSQRVRHNWATELNWTDAYVWCLFFSFKFELLVYWQNKQWPLRNTHWLYSSLTKILVGFPLLLSIKCRFLSTASKTLLDLVSSQPHLLWHSYPHAFQPGCVSVPLIHCAFTPSCDFWHVPSSVWNTFPSLLCLVNSSSSFRAQLMLHYLWHSCSGLGLPSLDSSILAP